LRGLEIARMISDGTNGRIGLGGDANAVLNPNPYSAGVNPGNAVEVNSSVPAVVPVLAGNPTTGFLTPNPAGGTGFSGLRFTDLTANSTPVTANPGLGVLSINPAGDVIYVPAAPGGIGDCPTPTILPATHGAIDMFPNNANFHFLGNNSLSLNDNNVMIGAVFPNCPIPAAKLHVLQSSDILSGGSSGLLVENTDFGTNTIDWCNPTIGIKSLVSNTTLTSSLNRKIAGWFEARPSTAAEQTLAIFVPPAGGEVSIGYDCNSVLTSGYLIKVNSSAWSAGTWIDFSDQSVKQNIDTIDDPLGKIDNIKGVYYYYDTLGYPNHNFPSDRQVGFIAQNVDTVLHEVVDGDNGSIGIAYGRMTPLLLEAVKKLNKKVEYLEDLVGECCEQEPVMVCHNGNTMTISQNALQAHLNHGDLLGPCPPFKTGGGNEGGEIGEINEPIYEKLVSKGVILYDAVPNPFQNQVSIGFFIPERIIHAEIVFHDNFGRTLKTVQVNQRGNGTVIIDASDLASGIYTYGIVTDGQAIDTKKMIRSK